MKTQEIILEQEANLREETLVASDYSLEYDRKTSALAKEIRNEISSHEEKLRYWKNWHIDNHKKELFAERVKWEKKLLAAKSNLNRYENVLREIKIELWKASIEYNKRLRRHERFSHYSKPEPVDSIKYQNNITLTQTIIDSLNRVVSRLEGSKPITEEEIKDLERSPTQNAMILSYQDSISVSKKRLEDVIRFLSEEYEKHLNSSLAKIEKMQEDLRITQTVYDSIAALHTNAVIQLSKFEGYPQSP